MSIALAQDVRRLREEIESLKKRIEKIENKPKPGPKPKRLNNAVGQ